VVWAKNLYEEKNLKYPMMHYLGGFEHSTQEKRLTDITWMPLSSIPIALSRQLQLRLESILHRYSSPMLADRSFKNIPLASCHLLTMNSALDLTVPVR